MTFPIHTQAVLLLTAYFSKPEPGDAKPLTPREWDRFSYWLNGTSASPETLMAGNARESLTGWLDRSVTHERIEQLVNRGAALAFAMDKWQRAGVWVLTRSDRAYPAVLTRRLRADSPPVLFGCGNQKLLNQGGIAVVGSRSARDADLEFSRHLGCVAAQHGHSIVSGAARGIDEAAMLGALDVEGTAVGVVAHGLLQASASAKYRTYLANDNLVLVSPFYPKAGFNAGNAMARNKYIYCLADMAVALHSADKGGTWNGAMENLRRGWVPMWVKETDDPAAGNAEIVRSGGKWISSSLEDIEGLPLFAG